MKGSASQRLWAEGWRCLDSSKAKSGCLLAFTSLQAAYSQLLEVKSIRFEETSLNLSELSPKAKLLMPFCWRTVNLSPAPHPISNSKCKVTYGNASKHTVNYVLGFCAFLLRFPSYTTPQFPFRHHTYCAHLHHLQGIRPVPGKDLHQCADRHTEESAPRADSTSWYLRACLGLTRLSFSKFLSWLGCRAWRKSSDAPPSEP